MPSKLTFDIKITQKSEETNPNPKIRQNQPKKRKHHKKQKKTTKKRIKHTKNHTKNRRNQPKIKNQTKIRKNIGIDVEVKATTNIDPATDVTTEKKVELTKNSPEPKIEEKKEIEKSDKTK